MIGVSGLAQRHASKRDRRRNFAGPAAPSGGIDRIGPLGRGGCGSINARQPAEARGSVPAGNPGRLLFFGQPAAEVPAEVLGDELL